MTAHILYTKYDKKCCNFFKNNNQKYNKKKIGFKGILISDDISMKALKYNLVENAKNRFKPDVI